MTVDSPRQVDYEIVDVTPEIAQLWLDRNTHNRKMRGAVVNKYARDMARGLWKFNGETIKFDSNGMLQDGQHRLNAVVQSRTTQRFLVVSNLPPEAHETLDSGAKRTPGDVLTLSGYTEGKTLATMTRMALQVELSPHTVRETRNWSTAEIKARVERDPLLVEVVQEHLPELPRSLWPLASRAVIGYAYYRLMQLNADAAREFFTKLGTLANLAADDPILALHRRLNAHSQAPKTSFYAWEQVAYIFMAWNAWRKGEPRTVIKLSHDDGRLKLVPPI